MIVNNRKDSSRNCWYKTAVLNIYRDLLKACLASININKVMALFLLHIMFGQVYAIELNDPMRPADQHQKPGMKRGGPYFVPTWNLSLTLVSDGRQVAVINGRLVKKGDWVLGARVTNISSHKVKLNYKGKAVTLKLAKNSLRKPVARPSQ